MLSSIKKIILIASIINCINLYCAESGFFDNVTRPVERYSTRIRTSLPNLHDQATVQQSLLTAGLDAQLATSEIGGYGTIAQCITKAANWGKGTQLAGIGTSLAQNMYLLALPESTLASLGIASVVPYAGIAATAVSIFGSLLGGDDEVDNSFAIELFNFLNTFYEHVMIRFDHLEDMLDIHHRKVMHFLFKLHQHQSDMRAEMRLMHHELMQNQTQIKCALQTMYQTAESYQVQTNQQFADLRFEKIDETLSNIQFDLERGAITSANLVSIIHQLYNCIAITAKSMSLTGSATQNIQQELASNQSSNPYNHPAFNHINLIKEYGERHYDAAPSVPVVNPLLWARCVQTLLAVLEQANRLSLSSDGDKSAMLSDIGEIFRIGQAALAVIERIHQEPCVQKLIDNCKATLMAFKKITDAHMQQHVDEALKQEMIARIERISQEDIFAYNQVPPINFAQLAANLSTLGRNLVDLKPGDIHFTHKESCCSIVIGSAGGYLPQHIMASQAPAVHIDLYRQNWGKNPLLVGERQQEQVHRRGNCIATLDGHRTHRISLIKQNVNNVGPLSPLIYPSGNAASNKLILFDEFNTINPFVDSEFGRAELLGLGRIRYEYDINGGNFYLRVYFIHGDPQQKQLIKERYVPYDAIDTSDEQIYNFFYGGRYAKSGDRVRVQGRACSDFFEEYKCYGWKAGVLFPPATPYVPACTTLYQLNNMPNLDTIRFNAMQAVAGRVQQQRLAANALVIDAVSSPAASPMQSIINQLDEQYKILESSCALAYGEQFSQHPACALFRTNDVIKNRAAIFTFLKRYQDAATDLSNQPEYVPPQQLHQSLEAFEETKRALIRCKPERSLVRAFLVQLQRALQRSGEIPVIERVPMTPILSQRIEELHDQQHELRGELTQVRHDIVQLGTSMQAGFAQLVELLKQKSSNV